MIGKRSSIWVGLLAFALWLAIVSPSKADFMYIVKPGDSAWSISVHFGITLEELFKANGWAVDQDPVLQIGQCLAIPTPKNGKSAGQSGPEGEGSSTDGSGILYIVQPGDNPFLIAQKYHTTNLALLEYNGLTENDLLRVGQTLKIPTTEYVYQGSAETGDDAVIASDDSQSLYKGSDLRNRSMRSRYTVVAGDTLLGIARSQGVALSELLAANNLTADSKLKIGQELIIPGYRRTSPEPDTQDPPGSQPESEDLSDKVVPLPGLPGSDSEEDDWHSEIFDFRQIPNPSPSTPDLQEEAAKNSQWSIDGKFDDGKPYHKYTIRRGDTVGAVAHAFNVTQSDLMDRNELDTRSMLRIGRDIKIPLNIPEPPKRTSHGKQVRPTQEPDRRGPIGSAGGTKTGRSVVEEAMRHMGVPYVWSGTSLSGGADCSGFTMSVFGLYDVDLPHRAKDQAGCGTAVDYENLQPGDLVFFHTTRSGISHVGIYIGNGEFIHSSSHNGGVTVSPLNSGYYNRRFVCARRVL